MKIKNNAKRTTFLTLLLIFALSATHSLAETIPIPRKRPAVMNASPAYIAELMARKKVDDSAISKAEKLNAIPPSSLGDQDFIVDDEGDLNTIENIDTKRLLSALSNDDVNKPTPDSVIKPSVNTLDNNNSDLTSGEAALVSFTLKPNQINLDTDQELFLIEYAISMFKNDPDLKMEIHAYATLDNNKAFSDVRKSLARALEVRRFLLSENIDPSRLKLTPKGHNENNKSFNRIDLLFVAEK